MRKSVKPSPNKSEYKQAAYIPEEDDEIDDEIVRRNTISMQQRANLESRDGTGQDRKNMFHKTRQTKQALPPPMITLQPAEEDSNNEEGGIGRKSRFSTAGGGSALSPVGNILINNNERKAMKAGEDNTETDDKHGKKEAEKKEGGGGASAAAGLLGNTEASTKPKTAYQRFDTSKFKKLAKKQIVKQQIVGAVRNVLGVKDNTFMREQMIEREKLNIPPMIRATMSSEIKPIMDKISISYRKYYPDRNNEKGWQLGSQALLRAKELAKINEATTIKPQTHFQRMLYGDKVGHYYDSDDSQEDPDNSDDDIRGGRSIGSRGMRTSMMSTSRNFRNSSVFSSKIQGVFLRSSMAVKSKFFSPSSTNLPKMSDGDDRSKGEGGRQNKRNMIRNDRPFDNIRQQMRQHTNDLFAGSKKKSFQAFDPNNIALG